MLDRVDETLDRRLAGFLVGLYLEDVPTHEKMDILVCLTDCGSRKSMC